MSTENNPELSALRTQVFAMLVALVVLAMCLTVYLYRQASMEGKQLAQAGKVIAAYNQQQPAIINLLNELVAYGQTHPDFTRTVLRKYGLGGAKPTSSTNSR